MKVITFSRYYPKGHPRAGEQTHFVEKIWRSFIADGELPKEFNKYIDAYENLCSSIPGVDLMAHPNSVDPKGHTIRAGNRWKVGDKFSPRVWSGRPYATKQITIAPDIEIKKIWDYETDFNGVPSINGFYMPEKIGDMDAWELLAKNDGLTLDDFIAWFRIHPKKNKDDWSFKGQILCWNESINY